MIFSNKQLGLKSTELKNKHGDRSVTGKGVQSLVHLLNVSVLAQAKFHSMLLKICKFRDLGFACSAPPGAINNDFRHIPPF